MKRFLIRAYEYIFYSKIRKSQKRYWSEVRDNQRNSKWEYFDKKEEEG